MAILICSGQTSYTNASAWLNAQADIMRTGPTTARVTVYWQLYTAGSSLNSADRWVHIIEPNGNYPASGHYIGGSWAYRTEYGTNSGAGAAQFDINISPYASSITLGVKVLGPGATGGTTLTWDGSKRTETGNPNIQYGTLSYPAHIAGVTFSHQIINVAGSAWSQYTASSTSATYGSTINPASYAVGIAGFYLSTSETNPPFSVSGDTTKHLYYRRNPVSITVNSNGGSGGRITWSTPAWYGGNGALTPPSRTGYTFAGWTGTSGSYALSGNSITNVTTSGTVTAGWRVNNYTITFDPTGGNGPSSKTKIIAYGAAYGALPTTTRKSYDFLGWFTAKSGGTRITEKTLCNGNATVYAQWKLAILYDRIPIHTSSGSLLAKPYIYTKDGWRGGAIRIGDESGWRITVVNPIDFK